MTKEQFAELIDNGSDIMIDVADRHFTILTWCEEGIGIDEQYPNEKGLTYYAAGKELIEQFKVNGVPLEKLLTQVKITDYS